MGLPNRGLADQCRASQATPAVDQIGVEPVAQRNRRHRCPRLFALPEHLRFELACVFAPLYRRLG